MRLLRHGAAVWRPQIPIRNRLIGEHAATARFDSFTLRDNRTDLLAVEGKQ